MENLDMIDVKTGKVYKSTPTSEIVCLYICLHAEKNFSILLEIPQEGKVEIIRYWRRNFVGLTLL